MGLPTSVYVDDILARGSIRDSDVLRLRRALNEEQFVTLEDAEALWRLDDACPVKDPAWADFFIEALTDYIVHQAQPEGYIVSEKAQWLIGRIAPDGRIRGRVQLDLLIAVIDAARWSPASLVAFALEQIKIAIQTGSGPLRIGTAIEPGAISSGDIELARRILLAFGGDGIATTRIEAEALLAIDAAIAAGKSTPAWTDFLVKAIGIGVLSALGRVVPLRRDVLKANDVEGRIARVHSGRLAPAAAQQFGAFAGTMIAAGAGMIWASPRPQSSEERAMSRLARQRLEIVTNERIEETDESWILSRFNRPALGENEIAVLAYVKHEAGPLPQPLTDLLTRVHLA